MRQAMICFLSSDAVPRAMLVLGLALAFIGPPTAEGGSTNQVTLRNYLTGHGYEAIPLKWTGDNHLFVEGKVNGREAVFFVDTGAGVTAIDQTLATSMKPVERLQPTFPI